MTTQTTRSKRSLPSISQTPGKSRRQISTMENCITVSLAPCIGLCYTVDVSLIHLDNLSRHYGRRRGVERVSLSVSEGALFGFLGPNGAGKTTTIRVLLGFLRPTAGAAKKIGRAS